MNDPRNSSSSYNHCLSREKLLLILETARAVGSLRFLRQTALAWLTTFPGDLAVNLLLARGLLAEGKPLQAIPILQKLCRLDPEYEEALAVLAQASQEVDPGASNKALAGYQVMRKGAPVDVSMPGWIRLLRAARLALQEGRIEDAEKMAHQVLETDPDNVLAAILQVQLTSARKEAIAVLNQAQVYGTRWPDCLHFSLLAAEAMLETGNEVDAVNQLHRCVVNDAAAQVPERIWGQSFPYRPLWPEPLEITFDTPIPADVAARLGWNLLPASHSSILEAEDYKLVSPHALDAEDIFAIPGEDPAAVPQPPAEDEPVFPFIEALLRREEDNAPILEEEEAESTQMDMEAGDGLAAEQKELNPSSAGAPATPVTPAAKQPQADSLKSVQEEFERIAKRIKRPGIARSDGRFPLYVLFTTRAGLAKQYGTRTLEVIDRELSQLADQIRKRPGWGALVYYADSPECAAKFGLQPVENNDPWKLKLALADLDTVLGKKGEMIGALVIVGGPDVIPYHHLPNPTDDMDDEIASDNPYGTVDSNYFVPEWPVGRLPGEAGSEPGLLLEQIRQITRYHARGRMSFGSGAANLNFWRRVQAFLQTRTGNGKKSFGYTAAVWKRSSQAVFRPIGETNALLASPPQSSASLRKNKKGSLSLAYYNLHGLVDAAEWYGHRDTAEGASGPDYPVALSPKDITAKEHTPGIIFSEACYGGHVQGKGEDQSLAIKFMAHGTMAIIASTSASYGSVTEPLIAADLLGNFFWRSLRAGRAAGEAFTQAKIDFVREMNKRQGFLDGEDQKTLISFVYYGDPLVCAEQYGPQSKGILRNRVRPALKTISDQKDERDEPRQVSGEVLGQVKQIVDAYLPGMAHGEMRLCEQEVTSAGKTKDQPGAKGLAEEVRRVVVTISSKVRLGQHVQHTCARVTLDQHGKMVKLALTR